MDCMSFSKVSIFSQRDPSLSLIFFRRRIPKAVCVRKWALTDRAYACPDICVTEASAYTSFQTSSNPLPNMICPIQPKNDIIRWKPPKRTITLDKSLFDPHAATISTALAYRGWSNVTKHAVWPCFLHWSAAYLSAVWIVVRLLGSKLMKGIASIADLLPDPQLPDCMKPFQ